MPEISVIIPTYEHGDTIARALDLVFGQTLKDIEVIVINDGSTDDTAKVLKPYLDRIIYKEIPNSGAPKARNVGFGLSHGKYVIFCDADAVAMDPRMLEKLLNALIDHPEASYAYGGFRFGLAHFRPQPFDAEKLKKLNYIHTTSLIRREAFVEFDESIKKFQDWDLWLTMLEKGRIGVAVDATLISFEPRGTGISRWLPKILYSRFFDALGIRFKSVIRYRHFADIIAKKHGLDLAAKPNPGSWWWLAFLAAFAVSAISFGQPWFNTVVSLLVVVLVVMASLNRLVFGVAIILAELIFGSLAGKTLALVLPGFTLPLRLALFAIVGLVWLVRLWQKRVRLPPKNIFIGVIVMLALVGWGIVNGLLHGLLFSDVFFDANAYFALPLILFFASAVEDERDQELLKKILKNGAIALSILTLVALYFFSHKFWDQAGVFAYKWLRDTRIAEITALDGGIYRIFIQSQLFCLLAFIWIALAAKRGHAPYLTEKGSVPLKDWRTWLWGILPATALIISGSRSFAIGLGVAAIVWFVMMIGRTSSQTRGLGTGSDRITAFAGIVKKVLVFILASLAIYALVLWLPWPALRSQTSFQDMLRSRSVSDRDAATQSRWSLLPKLNQKIMAAPIFGNGFGTSVTYQSSDPRIVSTTGGTYTTSAFEWGYHDILVKMGLVGLLAYVFLLWSILLVLLKADPKERFWLIPSFFALLAVNAVSPFLNHPLGIGYLALLLALSERRRGDIIPVAEVIKARVLPIAAAAPAGVTMMSEE